MTTYYVRLSGNDSNAGTSAGAAWRTLGKALGAAGIASGDIVYVGAGTYREVVTVAMTSPVAETKVIADVDGAQTGDAGEVIWSAFTTNDTSAPSGSSLLDLAGRDFLTFERITIVAGSVAPISAATTTSTDIKFTECVINNLHSNPVTFNVVAGAGVALNWTIDRCIFWGRTTIAQFTLTRHSADYDVNVLIQNSLLLAMTNSCVFVTATGAGAGFGGGVDVRNCTLFGGASVIQTAANVATSIPCTVNNCVILGTTGLNANTAGQITENYNLIKAATPRTNVTAGTNSQVNYAPLMNLSHEHLVVGTMPRLLGTPQAGSPLLGFGDDGTAPSVDLLNRPRPAGGASTSKAVGALERHDTAAKETSVTDSGGVGAKITGPGDQDMWVPVDAAATTITVRARYDTNHAATNKPQAILVANGEIAVTTSTATMTAAVDTWETLTIGPFTPTGKGFVRVRLVSRSAAGNGIAYFDSLTVAG